MTIIADASALILLSKAGVLELLVERNNVITTKVVYEEVIKGKEKGRSDSLLVERLVREGLLRVKFPNKSVKKKVERLFNLKAGELEVISLAYKTKNAVLSDDRKCLTASNALGIQFMCSLDIIIAMYRRKAINKQRALECIERLEEYGWYAKDLIKNYKEEIK